MAPDGKAGAGADGGAAKTTFMRHLSSYHLPDARLPRYCCACLQELQLLTAKQELEQTVERLKAQAEQKGVHLSAPAAGTFHMAV